MEPRNLSIRDLAIYAPKIAYGMIVGVPRVPFVNEIHLQFSSSAVNATPIDQSFQNNISQDTLIERVSYSISQPNSFPGSPFQSLYFNQLKQSGRTGIGVQMQVFGGPKYAVNDTFVDLGTLIDVFASTWPNGWPLAKQSNVKVLAMLLDTPVSVPIDVSLTFLGWQFLDKALDDMSPDECRARLKAMGIEVPDLSLIPGRP